MSKRSKGARVLLLTGTHNRARVGSLVLLFSGPWFGFYSHHLSAVRLKASLVSKGGDERRMTCLCSLPKRPFWDTNQGMTVRAGNYLQLGAQRAKPSLSADSSLSSWCFSFFFSFSVPLLVSAVMLKAARCVFDCLCLREGSAGWLQLSVRRSLSLWFSPLINLSDNLSRSPPLCFVFFFFSELYQGSRLW